LTNVPPAGREKAIVVGLVLPGTTRQNVEEHLEELSKLVEAAGGSVVARLTQDRRNPDPASYIGKGKAEEIGGLLKSKDATLVVVDDEISGAQARNLEKLTGGKVIDRSALILDIFARRARSRESRTQVELAQLNYLLPRLTRQWSHLGRQAGGIGSRGVGETQLELDRRMIRTRIARLKEDLQKIEKNRDVQRRSRSSVYTVALVGYTNAGKSTLFNQLTAGDALAVDQLFATLDAKTQRSVHAFPRETVFIDTVGFIRKLPHHLVASFRSTMEEAVSADLVLHVINLGHPHVEEQREVGREVLADLGIDKKRVIEVYNKVDAVPSEPDLRSYDGDSAAVSALTGRGIERLLDIMRNRELAEGQVLQLRIPHESARSIARLHEVAVINASRSDDDALEANVWLPNDLVHEFDSFVIEDARQTSRVAS
jgi:GTP-binding protein HflX